MGVLYLDFDLDYFVKPVFKSSTNGIRLYKNENCEIGDVICFFEKLLKKIEIPSEKHIFTNHKKSFIYWWMKRFTDCTVIHIDAHSDLYRNKHADLRTLSDVEMNCDDYLWYAMRDDFVSDIYWVCPDDSPYIGNLTLSQNMICPSMIKKIEKSNNAINIDFEVINRVGIKKDKRLFVLGIDSLPVFKDPVSMLTFSTSPEFIPGFADRLIDEVDSILHFNRDNIEYVKRMHEIMPSST